MSESANANIPVLKKSEINYPSPEQFLLFYDSENSNHLTGVKNIAGVFSFFDYENTASYFNRFNVQTVGLVNVDTVLSFPSSAGQSIEIIASASNVALNKGFSKVFSFGNTFTGASFTFLQGSASDFGTVDVTILAVTGTTITIRATGEALETVNFVIGYNLITK